MKFYIWKQSAIHWNIQEALDLHTVIPSSTEIPIIPQLWKTFSITCDLKRANLSGLEDPTPQDSPTQLWNAFRRIVLKRHSTSCEATSERLPACSKIQWHLFSIICWHTLSHLATTKHSRHLLQLSFLCNSISLGNQNTSASISTKTTSLHGMKTTIQRTL